MRLSPARRHTPRVAMALTSITLSVAAMSIGTSEAQAAETLAEALASAYRHNPALLAQRRAVEAVDEGVTQARAGFRPRVVSAADAGHQHTRTNFAASAGGGSTESSTRPRGYSIEISQNVFAGFRTVNAIKQAEANVLASRENLRQTEQSVLLDAVTAYVDVLRDRAIVRLQENNVRVLTSELRATRERFEAGDVSRTDVAQAEARRAAAVSALDLARANLRTSEASFQQVVGHMPGALRQPAPPVRNIPATLPEGIRRAVEETPNVLNAAFLEQAAAHNVDQITGELLPTVDLEANYSDRYDLSETVDRTETATFTARMTLPLYQGGQVYSRIRQARRTREQRGQEIENARRIARQALIAAWSSRRAAIAQLDSDRIRVRAQRTALAGVRAEEDVGQRSILDVLDAEQELLDAQVALVTTRRDLVVAGYSVLSATGRLTAADADLHVLQHDPELHYGLVRRKPWGTRTVRNEAYDNYVTVDHDERRAEADSLAENVIRLARDAHDFMHTELRREDDLGRWDGSTDVVIEEGGLKDTDADAFTTEIVPDRRHAARRVDHFPRDAGATFKLRPGAKPLLTTPLEAAVSVVPGATAPGQTRGDAFGGDR